MTDRAARARQAATLRPPSSSPAGARSSVTRVSTVSGLSILPLRLFLGVTFLYAGIQKIMDPGFFRLGSSTYIGTQLLGFSRGSPIHFIMVHMLEHAKLIGVLTILTELVIGALTLLGLFTRAAAVSGFILNLVLFLSASWRVYPYFLDPDIVFVVCWGTLALTGPGALCLDAVLQDHPLRQRLPPLAQWAVLGPFRRPEPLGASEAIDQSPQRSRGRLLTRAEAVVGGIAALGVLILGLLPRGRPSAQIAAVASKSAGTGGASVPGGAQSGSSGVPKGAKRIGNISQLPPNSAGAVTDPQSGDPAVVVRFLGTDVRAFDAVCTHAGCTVQYDPQSRLLVCPCHGGAFDPKQGAQVVAGPPPSPLTQLTVSVDSKGDIYLV
ncbi:MAG: TQO small subunit DoxD [Chloroflexota bacterium]|nr:MAG: hypothetical protein DLM70_16465 [Chloroflexota bacterium]